MDEPIRIKTPLQKLSESIDQLMSMANEELSQMRMINSKTLSAKSEGQLQAFQMVKDLISDSHADELKTFRMAIEDFGDIASSNQWDTPTIIKNSEYYLRKNFQTGLIVLTKNKQQPDARKH